MQLHWCALDRVCRKMMRQLQGNSQLLSLQKTRIRCAIHRFDSQEIVRMDFQRCCILAVCNGWKPCKMVETSAWDFSWCCLDKWNFSTVRDSQTVVLHVGRWLYITSVPAVNFQSKVAHKWSKAKQLQVNYFQSKAAYKWSKAKQLQVNYFQSKAAYKWSKAKQLQVN